MRKTAIILGLTVLFSILPKFEGVAEGDFFFNTSEVRIGDKMFKWELVASEFYKHTTLGWTGHKLFAAVDECDENGWRCEELSDFSVRVATLNEHNQLEYSKPLVGELPYQITDLHEGVSYIYVLYSKQNYVLGTLVVPVPHAEERPIPHVPQPVQGTSTAVTLPALATPHFSLTTNGTQTVSLGTGTATKVMDFFLVGSKDYVANLRELKVAYQSNGTCDTPSPVAHVYLSDITTDMSGASNITRSLYLDNWLEKYLDLFYINETLPKNSVMHLGLFVQLDHSCSTKNLSDITFTVNSAKFIREDGIWSEEVQGLPVVSQLMVK